MPDSRFFAQLLPFVLGTIFGAGAAWAKLKATERGLNGVGRKVNKALIAQIVTAKTEPERWERAHFFFDLT